MNRFWESLNEGVIVQSLVTLGLTAAIIYLGVTGKEISDALFALATTALGFWFGSKAQLTGRQAAREVVKQFRAENKEIA